MQINPKERKISRNILDLKIAIQDAIDKLCKEHDYQLTYAEINYALIQTLNSNVGCELKDMWKGEE